MLLLLFHFTWFCLIKTYFDSMSSISAHNLQMFPLIPTKLMTTGTMALKYHTDLVHLILVNLAYNENDLWLTIHCVLWGYTLRVINIYRRQKNPANALQSHTHIYIYYIKCRMVAILNSMRHNERIITNVTPRHRVDSRHIISIPPDEFALRYLVNIVSTTRESPYSLHWWKE